MKHRTKLYYEILKKAGKLTIHVTITLEILTDNGREIGIKQNRSIQRNCFGSILHGKADFPHHF